MQILVRIQLEYIGTRFLLVPSCSVEYCMKILLGHPCKTTPNRASGLNCVVVFVVVVVVGTVVHTKIATYHHSMGYDNTGAL